MLYIRTGNDQTGFAPGDTVRGVYGWDCAQAPGRAMLTLLWRTEGRGTSDMGIVSGIEAQHPSAIYEAPFELTLPNGPYSFSGKLITLHWAIELLLDNGEDLHRLDVLVSPWETEVRLPQEVEELG
ncbi:MAG: hypothetical protein HYV27_21585 [Candidatus Hydrogenedentes bacterium]|nr:hypothetical protein [Candidatus Hydrogenedentota bacterium]